MFALKLAQKTHVALKESAQVTNLILQHGDAFNPHPEGKA